MTLLLELTEVSKRFGSTQALDQVSFDVQAGEVHALVGENGAGKSTLLGLIYGVAQPDAGEVRIADRAVSIASPAVAQALGVGCVFQELSLASSISVAENIFAGHPPTRFGIIHRARMEREAAALLASFDMPIDVGAAVGSLPTGAQQVVEIAKAVAIGSSLLLLDEPTSALTPDEVAALHRLIGTLKRRGIGIIYVSHQIADIFAVADRVTVLRDGRHISTRPIAATSPGVVIAEMTGTATAAASAAARPVPGAVVLEARGLASGRGAMPIDLELRGGEITAFAGLMGAGAPTLARTLCGLARRGHRRGRLTVAGRPVRTGSFSAARRAGISFVPDERKTEGLFLDLSLTDNLTIATSAKHSHWGWWDGAAARRAARDAIARFEIKAPNPEIPARALSGGNQQKLMLAKWLETRPHVLIVNEPSKGVDVGAKRHIRMALRDAADAGAAVLVVSSDFPELLQLADRILVVRDGAIVGETRPGAASEAQLIALAAGTESNRPEATWQA